MDTILQHAQLPFIPPEGVNPVRYVVTHHVSRMQDGLSESDFKIYVELSRRGGAPDRFNNRVARVGIAELMQATGFSRSRVKRSRDRLKERKVIEVIEREDSRSHTPQMVKINSYRHVLAVWRQNGWTEVVRNRGVQFVAKSGELIKLVKPALPEFVKRAAAAIVKAVHKFAARKYAPPAEPLEAADAMWKQIREELRSTIIRQSFDTWIRPLRGWDLRGQVLYVKLPSIEFSHLGAKYSSEFAAALAKLKLDVKLEFFDSPPT